MTNVIITGATLLSQSGNAAKVDTSGGLQVALAIGGNVGKVDGFGSLQEAAADSAGFFVQSLDSTPLNISATATGTNNSADQVNTLHKGALFGLAVATVAASCTLRLNVQGKDPQSGIYFTMASLSVDNASITVGGGSQFLGALEIYPGATNATQEPFGPNVFGFAMPRTFRVQVSMTATASGGGAATSYSVSQTKIL